MPPVTNAVLSAKLDAMIEKSDERHTANVRRLDDILLEQRKTNGRISKAEGTLVAHTWAIYVIGAAALALFSAILAKFLR